MQDAYNYALYLISRQDYSVHKIKQKLKSKKYELPVIEETIQKLIEKNYLREAEYQRLFIRKWLRKGLADQSIIYKGQSEGLKIISSQIAEEREETHISSDSAVLELVNKKLRNQEIPTDREQKQKLFQKITRFLLSKGYSYDVIQKELKKLSNTELLHQ